MKPNIKHLILVLAVIFVGMVEVANAFYDPGLQRWINRDPIGVSGGINIFAFSQNTPIDTVDLMGLDCYRQNRQLWPVLLNHQPWPRSKYNPISHTFVFTTNPDGTIKDIYSWGTDENTCGWTKKSGKELSGPDYEAAKRALEMGGNYLDKLGDSSLDPFIHDAYEEMKDQQHKNGLLRNNCKTEAHKLIDRAEELKENSEREKRCTSNGFKTSNPSS